jgi:hypothetical protein
MHHRPINLGYPNDAPAEVVAEVNCLAEAEASSAGRADRRTTPRKMLIWLPEADYAAMLAELGLDDEPDPDAAA